MEELKYFSYKRGEQAELNQEYISHSINSQHYALNYINSLLNVQVPTCFGSSLPSSESFLDPCELLEMQKKYVCDISYNVSLCGVCAGVLSLGSVVSSDVVVMRTTSLDTTHPTTIFYQLFLN
jgi:hypothetical protein